MSSTAPAPPPASGRQISPRLISARLLSRWQATPAARRPALNTLVHDELSRLPGLSDEDRGLAGEIISGSVRWLRLLSTIFESRLKKPGKLSPVVRAILITACYQLLFLDRVPSFAVVNEAVKVTRALKASWASGLVNAVLRQILRDIERLGGSRLLIEHAAAGGRDDADRTAIKYSYPTWMVRRWIASYGMEQAEKICIAGNSMPPLDLRVNTLKATVESASEILERHGLEVTRTQLSPVGIELRSFRGNPAKIPGFSDGLFYVQDQAAQLVSMILQCRPKMKILDMCAGLGGKTTHIAELTGNSPGIDAWDASRSRLALLKENAERLGISCINILSDDDFQQKESCRCYDRILIDAPCSGIGVIRRHPDIKWNREKDDIKRLSEIQQGILHRASSMLGPLGKMVYAVCTIEPEETTEAVRRFCSSHAGWRCMPVTEAGLDIPAKYVTEEGFLRILPEERGPDGFFAAILGLGE